MICPGHNQLYTFKPVRVEYNVADVQDNIHCVSSTGEENIFRICEETVYEQLELEFNANTKEGGDKYWTITVIYMPRLLNGK